MLCPGAQLSVPVNLVHVPVLMHVLSWCFSNLKLVFLSSVLVVFWPKLTWCPCSDACAVLMHVAWLPVLMHVAWLPVLMHVAWLPVLVYLSWCTCPDVPLLVYRVLVFLSWYSCPGLCIPVLVFLSWYLLAWYSCPGVLVLSCYFWCPLGGGGGGGGALCVQCFVIVLRLLVNFCPGICMYNGLRNTKHIRQYWVAILNTL